MTLEVVWLLIRQAFWAGVAALGFAILFNVPVRTLLGCIVCGAVGVGIRTVFQQIGVGIEIATLIGATVVGFLGLSFARRMRTPASTFTVSGVIPMVPGTFAFRTMIGLVTLTTASATAAPTLLVETSVDAIKTGFILTAIALGIAAPSLLFRRRKTVL